MRRFRSLNIALALLILLVFAAFILPGCGWFSNGGKSNGTAPVKEKGGFKFIVCGDPHSNYEVFRKVIAAANTVDFLIIAGDLTRTGNKIDVQVFLKEMQACKVPYYCVPGNHDVEVTPVEVSFEPYFGEVPRSFDFGNSHFVLLDNSDPAQGFYPAEQEWAKADLDAASKRGYEHIFAVCHVPPGYPYGASTSPEARVGIKANKELVRVLSSRGVEELFCGHFHSYRQFDEYGMTITITGGAGAELFGVYSNYHYVLVEINGKNKTETKVEIE